MRPTCELALLLLSLLLLEELAVFVRQVAPPLRVLEIHAKGFGQTEGHIGDVIVLIGAYRSGRGNSSGACVVELSFVY